MKCVLKLFVANEHPASIRAIGNLKRIVGESLADGCEVTIVDILDQPEQAVQARIVATPVLIREGPLPVRRVIGDLSATESVLTGLGLLEMSATRGEGDAT